MNKAKIAWEAYAKAVGGKTFDDKPLPTWDELGERQKEGWKQASIFVENATRLEIISEISTKAE